MLMGYDASVTVDFKYFFKVPVTINTMDSDVC
jgi:hypothetical protein